MEGIYQCGVIIGYKRILSEPIQVKFNSQKIHLLIRFPELKFDITSENLGVLFTIELRKLISQFQETLVAGSLTVGADFESVRSGSVLIENVLFLQQNLKSYKYKIDILLEKLETFLNEEFSNKTFLSLFSNYGVIRRIELIRLYFKDFCRKSSVKHYLYNYEVEFAKSKVGQKSTAIRKCLNGEPIAIADCQLSPYGYPRRINIVWAPDEICYPSAGDNESTKTLKNISQTEITESNLDIILDKTNNVAKKDSLSPKDISYISMIIENVKASRLRPDVSPTLKLVEITNEILKTPDKDIIEANAMTLSSSKIVDSLEIIADRMNMKNLPKKAVRLFSPRISIDVWEGSKPSFNSYIVKDISNNGLLDNNTISAEWTGNSSSLNSSVASIHFEESLNLDGTIRIVTSIYANKKLFLKKGIVSKQYGKIISASISNFKLTNIDPPICAVFLPDDVNLEKIDMIKNVNCVYWDMVDNKWSSDGCYYNEAINGRIFCRCDHFTNFAVLLDIERTGEITNEALSYISVIGLSLSIAGLAFIIISFCIIK